MPEGLTNAPTTFQRFMNDIFAYMIDINVIVYLDNILVYSDDLMEHKRHVREVLRRLCTNGLFAHADKCNECRVDSISQQCYSITKLIYFWVLDRLFIQVGGLQSKQETARPLGATRTMTLE